MEGVSLDNNAGLSNIDLSGEKAAAAKITKAYELYASGQIQEAVNSLEQDMQASSNAYAQVLLGNCYHKLGQKDRAMSLWQRATDLSPLEYSAYLNIGNEHYSNGEIYQAIFNWHCAGSIAPENPVINLNLAVAYDKLGYRIKSTRYFEKYLKYNTNKTSPEYQKIKHAIANLTAKTEFYLKKSEEYRAQKDLQKVAASYLMLISTYAILPGIYTNLASIFVFDKNYEKAQEFYKIAYLNFPYSPSVLMNLANMEYLLGNKSYAYCYYKRVFQYLPESTSHWLQVKVKLAELAAVTRDSELIETHLQKAKEAEDVCQYEVAIDEYENYLILTESHSDEIQQLIDKYKIFLNPEPFVVKMLYSQISELMLSKKLHAAVEVCDRIMTMAEPHTKEMIYAMKCKVECKNVIIAREQFGA